MPNTEHPLIQLLKHTRHYRKQVILATSASVLNKVFDLAPPLLIGAAVDVVIAQDQSFIARFGVTDVAAQLVLLAGLTIVIWGLESVFEYASGVLWRNLAQTIQHELRMETYEQVQKLELTYFEDRSTGGLMAILNDDINQLERFLDSGANDIIQLATTVIVIGTIFIVMLPNIAWMALLPMPFVVWGTLWFNKMIAPRYADVREQNAVLNGQLANNLGGIATIKSFTAEQHEITRIYTQSQAYRERNRSAISISAAFSPIIRMIIVTGFTAILIFGGLAVVNGTLNVGAYSVMVFLTQRLLWPLTRIGVTIDLYQRAMASTVRVLDLLYTEPRIVAGPISLPTPTVQGDIRFEHICFEYESNQNGLDQGNRATTIHDLSLHIPAGETAAIVGPTGSGKTTLVKLLLRFYDVGRGVIRLDGHDIRDLQTDSLRKAIGFVSQDVFLFHGTVRENIAYGTFDANMDEIISAAKIAEAHDFIMALPHGYETIVGERGQKLSGGQRQRLSIARAVLKDPPVLILDEATSAVDNETEAAIQRSLARIAVGRTTIVIAHRLSTVRNAHQIFVLESGSLQETGGHEALIAANGLYAALWRVQTGAQTQP